MNMNETKKQIIELIEPYLDKTLSEGCLVELWEGEIIKIDKVGLEEYYFTYTDFITSSSRLEKIEFPDIKIIGHYDITAVLKYLKSKKIRLLKFDGEDFIYRSKEADFLIKGKPLHLYTKQEEIDLLELLKYIGKD